MDVTASRTIAARPGQVAAIMFDPRRDPEWIGGAKSVAAPKGDPTKIGTRVTRHGGFMGKKFSWTTEVAGHDPDHLLHMNFIEGPMKGGTVTYRIEPDGAASRVSIRNTGPGPQIMGWLVRRSVGKDLDRLAKLVARGAAD
jgi:carbon monoxide dehydrogenase subunit G